MKFDFGEKRKVQAYILQSGKQETGNKFNMPKSWFLKGSNDGLNWTILDKKVNQTDWGENEKRIYKLATPANYAYFQFLITQGNGHALRLPELELVETYNLEIVELTADSETSTPVKNLLDNNLGTFWETTGPFPHWVQCDIGRQSLISSYSLQTGFHGVGSTAAMPKDWELQGSNDRLTWTIIDERNDELWIEGEKRTFNINIKSPFRYYRLLVKKTMHPVAVRLYKIVIKEK